MTVTITLSENAYNGNGTTGPFAYAFKILQSSDLTVYVTSATGVITYLTLNVDYTVTGAGNDAGGNVTLTSGSLCPVGAGLTIQRNLPLVQQIADLVEGQAVSPELLERALDYLTLLVQDQSRKLAERDSRITTLEAAILALVQGTSGFVYVLNAADGPITLPASGIVYCAKAVGDTTATILDIIPGTVGQTIEGLTQYRDGLGVAGDSVVLIYNSGDNVWYRFGS